MNKFPIYQIFFSYLFTKKNEITSLSEDLIKTISMGADKFLMSGFLLNSNHFNMANDDLKRSLEDQRLISTLRMKQTSLDLLKIIQKFEDSKINITLLKGSALYLKNIYAPGLRFMRDIDFLVNKDQTSLAYDLLKEIGFHYLSPFTADEIDFHSRHQLPVMANKSGSLIELHSRVTAPRNYTDCPLTPYIVQTHSSYKQYKYVHLPSLDALIIHSIYHGTQHHLFKHGPVFLFDLAELFKQKEILDPEALKIINNMNLSTQLSKLKILIESLARDKSLTENNYKIIEEFFGNINWKFKKEKFSVLGLTERRLRIKDIKISMENKLNDTSYYYQTEKWTIKFWLLFLLECLKSIRKIRL